MIPLWVRAALAAAVLAALVGWLTVERHAAVQEGRDEVRAEWNKERAQQLQAAVDAAKRQKEANDEAVILAERARSARAAADAAGGRLRDQYAAAIHQAAGCAATVAGCKATTVTPDLLADVQRRIDAAAGELAAVADQRGTAGHACEREYDSLK